MAVIVNERGTATEIPRRRQRGTRCSAMPSGVSYPLTSHHSPLTSHTSRVSGESLGRPIKHPRELESTRTHAATLSRRARFARTSTRTRSPLRSSLFSASSKVRDISTARSLPCPPPKERLDGRTVAARPAPFRLTLAKPSDDAALGLARCHTSLARNPPPFPLSPSPRGPKQIGS